MTDNTQRMISMKTLIENAIDSVSVTVQDDSHLHVGHAGAKDGAGHFTVAIVSDVFQGKPPLARHRLVYKVVESMMPEHIHALVINAKTPTEV